VQGPRPEQQPGTDWPPLHEPFGDVPEANLFGHQLAADWNGGFELYVGGPKRGPNWLPTTAGSRKLFIRQGFDRWSERPARIRIERVGMAEPRPLPTPGVMIEAIDWAGRFVTGLMSDWPDHPYHYTRARYLDFVNQFPPDAADGGESDRRRGRAAANMTWVLSRDQALIIEFEPPRGLWSITNMGPFFTSMDFLYRPVSYTPSRTRTDADGAVRLVLCHEDPGYHNWLDTQGFERGNVTYRHLLGDESTALRTRVVDRRDLANVLPADSARVTREARVRQLRERFDGIRLRYGL
jgi:hypothetical protein